MQVMSVSKGHRTMRLKWEVVHCISGLCNTRMRREWERDCIIRGSSPAREALCPQACKQEMWTGSWWMWGERERKTQAPFIVSVFPEASLGGGGKKQEQREERERGETWVNAVKLVMFSKAFIPVLLRKHSLGRVPKYSCTLRPETKTSKLWSRTWGVKRSAKTITSCVLQRYHTDK